jgi:hypothetical protein
VINFGALRGALAAVRLGRDDQDAKVASVEEDAGRVLVSKPVAPVWTLGSTASLGGRLP